MTTLLKDATSIVLLGRPKADFTVHIYIKRKFITDKAGKVTGVLADAKDGQLPVNCRACVIASVGFGRNFEKLKKYWPEEYNNKELFCLCPPGMMGAVMFVSINLDGKRWKNESVFSGVSLGTQPRGVAYAVADDEIVETVGSRQASGGMRGPGGMPVSADSL